MPNKYGCFLEDRESFGGISGLSEFFKRFYLFIFRERGARWEWGREREREKRQCEKETPTGCPDQELSLGPFTFRDKVQPIEPHQLGLSFQIYVHF